MILGEAKDMIRKLVGNDELGVPLMKFGLDSGRRDIEKVENFYWMRNVKDWSLVVDQQDYSIVDSASGGLNLPLYKDLRILLWKKTTETVWTEVPIVGFQEAELTYATDDEDFPEMAVIDNETISIFPPKPQGTYDMRLYYWNWTANQTSNLLDDEILKRWPEALIYASVARLTYLATRSVESAAPWTALMNQEIEKMRKFNKDRLRDEKFMFKPRKGPNVGVSRHTYRGIYV
jgi:hypothetical protein